RLRAGRAPGDGPHAQREAAEAVAKQDGLLVTGSGPADGSRGAGGAQRESVANAIANALCFKRLLAFSTLRRQEVLHTGSSRTRGGALTQGGQASPPTGRVRGDLRRRIRRKLCGAHASERS